METARDGFWGRIIYIVSALGVAAVFFLVYGPRPEALDGKLDVSALPAVNASLNAVTTVLLLSGLVLVKRGHLVGHRRVMLAAFASSGLFLCSYVVYHAFQAGPRAYTGDVRGVYLTLLISHILLAAVILPMALFTLYRGWNGQLERHRKLARVTLPTWLYVSVTGVVIYAMLYL